MFGALEPPMLHAWFLFAVISEILPVKPQRSYFQVQLTPFVVIFTYKQSQIHHPVKIIYYRQILGKNVSARVKIALVTLFNKKKDKGILNLRNFLGFLPQRWKRNDRKFTKGKGQESKESYCLYWDDPIDCF